MATYIVDVAHSSIEFSVKHMMVSKVRGLFDSFSAQIEGENIADLTNTQIHFDINVASISTRDPARDHHLISADLFHADRYPKITFTKTDVIAIADEHFQIVGDLTIKDIKRSVTFDVKYNGHVINPWGTDTFGFSCYTKINRKDFNLTYNAVLESGNFLIDEQVEVSVELQLQPL